VTLFGSVAHGGAGVFGTDRRFYAALALGLLVWAATWGLHPMLRVLLASDVCFGLFVGQMLVSTASSTPERLKANAAAARSSLIPIMLLVAAAVIVSLVAIFTLLNHPKSEGGLFPIVAVSSVPLSWAMIHTVAALNYAGLYYAPTGSGGIAKGLAFPGGVEPSALDFLYYALVIGTSFSVSDVSTLSSRLRMATMLHSVASFVFNTVMIAIAVNAAITLAA
jgi:uncharacterized membrane protein